MEKRNKMQQKNTTYEIGTLGKFRLFKIDISKIINFDSCIGFT